MVGEPHVLAAALLRRVLPGSRLIDRAHRRAAALLGVATLTVMASAIISPSMPRMADAFRDAPHADLFTKLVLTMPALVIGLMAPLAGAVVDRFGRIRLLRASLALYGLAGSAGYLLQQLDMILISRAFLGLAIAGTMTCVNTLAGDYFQGEARARFASRQSMTMSIGAVLSFVVGGLMADADWRLPFLLYLAGWVLLVPVLMYLDEPPRASLQAATGGQAAVPWSRVMFVYVITFVLVAMFYMTAVQLPFLLREIGVERPALSGFAIATTSLTAALGSWWMPSLRRSVGPLRVYAVAFALMGIGYSVTGAFAHYIAVIVGAFIAGIGVGLFFPNSSLAVLTLAPPAVRGRVIGGLTTAIFLGQFASPVLVQPIVAMRGIGGAFAACGIGMILVAVVMAMMRDRLAVRQQ
jgi:MFS family permease